MPDQNDQNPQAHDYFDRPSHHASPVHIQAVAYLYGLDAPSVGGARVLEIGCGRGRNLQAFALTHPDAEVVGVDLSLEDLEKGLDEAEALGIQNMQFRQLMYADIDTSLGLFDYIIVRDVYTWASDEIRDAILHICKSNLTPNGIAYVGYHALPGSHIADTLRDAIQLHGSSEDTLGGIQPYAQAMLGLMAYGVSRHAESAQDLGEAARRMLQYPEYYIHADFLRRSTNASYLLDIVMAAQSAGLSYVGDALAGTEIASAHGTVVHMQNSLLTMGKGYEVRQQYLDFAVNRKYRQSLLVHSEARGSGASGLVKENFRELHIACGLKRKYAPTIKVDGDTIFRNTLDQEFGFSDSIVIAVCDALTASWPQTMSFDELLHAATIHTMPGVGHDIRAEALISTLYTLIPSDQLRLSRNAGPYNLCNSEKSIALFVPDSFVSDRESKERVIISFNLWNDPQTINLGRSPESIKNILKNIENKNSDLLKNNINLIDFIEQLRWSGLLHGSDAAWVEYYKTVLDIPSEDNEFKLFVLQKLVVHSCKNRSYESTNNEIPPKSNSLEIQKFLNALDKLRGQGKFDQLTREALDFIAKYPHMAEGWYMLALAKQGQGDHQAAIGELWKAISLNPENNQLYLSLSHSINMFSRAPIMLQLVSLSLWLNDTFSSAYVDLGTIYLGAEEPEQALKCYQYALSIDPKNTSAEINEGLALGTLGKTEQACQILGKCIRRSPDNFNIYSNYLYYLSLSDQMSSDAIYQEHKRFGQLVSKKTKESGLILKHNNIKDISRKIKLGFVSGDLYHHAVYFFIKPIFEYIDKEKFEVIIYDVSGIEDRYTQTLKSYADQWQQVGFLSFESLARQINNDGIDILFDLSGHTGKNRLPAFAYKPAPIQISWIGYPGTTGLKAMDYYITNKHAIPLGVGALEGQFTEKFVRLPTAASFSSVIDRPLPNSLPALENGYFTFGSFNRLNKINDDVYRAWCDILLAVPNSKFVLGHVATSSYKMLLELFQSKGVNPDRIIFEPRVSIDKYVALHHKIDLLLDTFPYCGGTTTMYGLWMGVPTITLAGDTLRSRTGASMLGPLGVDRLVASTLEEYVSHAVSWPHDLARLSEFRGQARHYFDMDSVYGAQSVTKNLEKALGIIWSDWCGSAKFTDVTIN